LQKAHESLWVLLYRLSNLGVRLLYALQHLREHLRISSDHGCQLVELRIVPELR